MVTAMKNYSSSWLLVQEWSLIWADRWVGEGVHIRAENISLPVIFNFEVTLHCFPVCNNQTIPFCQCGVRVYMLDYLSFVCHTLLYQSVNIQCMKYNNTGRWHPLLSIHWASRFLVFVITVLLYRRG